ncbi:MAG: DNA repair protein [Bacteroidetes bacterium]|nr:DNA repair protein [Bacteroidota bacterium]
MPTTLPICQIQFPEIKLATRDAHKLRGWFGNVFKEHSPLLHNHLEDGTYRMRYPLVQYKVLNQVPTLIGLDEGAQLLTKLFTQLKEININQRSYAINAKDISFSQTEIGYATTLHKYQFETLWMALNQQNHIAYLNIKLPAEKNEFLNRLLIGNLLSFLKSFNCMLLEQERLMAQVEVAEKSTLFKNQKMLVFTGSFVCNVVLPNHIGIGKSVSRGFGTIKKF